jgi:hypothetical protein
MKRPITLARAIAVKAGGAVALIANRRRSSRLVTLKALTVEEIKCTP